MARIWIILYICCMSSGLLSPVYAECLVSSEYSDDDYNIVGPSDTTADENTDATFNCSTNSSNVTITWYLDCSKAITSNRLVVEANNITLINVHHNQNGTVVTCNASDGDGVVFVGNAFLKVHYNNGNDSLPTHVLIIICVFGGLFVVLICIVLLLILICCFIRRKREMPTSPLIERKTTGSILDRPSIRLSLRKPKGLDPIEEFRRSSKTPEMESHPPVLRTAFVEHLSVLRTNENQLLLAEFGTIPMVLDYSRDYAQQPHNMEKNRYDNIFPYDHNRVKLPVVKWQEGSDYINASYLDGYRRLHGYIATQGPLQNTLGDFWRMIWEENSRTIVMVTNCKEKFTVKCEVYWPSELNTPISYGGIEVTMVESVALADFTIRTFSIVKGGSQKDIREVKQFHFTSWPDKGVPDFPTALLAMVRAVRTYHYSQHNTGPMIVHCSAGVGRTGTFIVIDSMLSKVLHEDSYIDIYGYVTLLRNKRNYMIQTDDQYFFVHEAIAEAITCGVTEVRVEEFPPYLDKLELIQEDGDNNLLETEFKRLLTDRTEPHRFASATKNVNKGKNRFVNIMPYEFNRVKLSFIRATEGSDYINASYVDNYRRQKAFIATQGPLRNTVQDFWRMVWEQRCPIVVMLTLLEERQQECCAPLWSEGGKKKFGDMYVEVGNTRDEEDYDYKEIHLSHAEEPDSPPRIVRAFQFFGWPERGVPESALPLLDFIQEIQKLYITVKSDKPVVVMCSSGVGRTGVFITLDIILERLAVEGLVDLFQTVKMLRIQRSAMVQTLEQYHFCYVAVLDYLLHHGFLNQKNNRSASVERRASVKLTKSVSPEQLLTDMDDDHTADGRQNSHTTSTT